MSGGKIDKLVRMANQIGDYFKVMPEQRGGERRGRPFAALLDAEDDRRNHCLSPIPDIPA